MGTTSSPWAWIHASASWPARQVAARLFGERSLEAGEAAQEAAWDALLRLAEDREKWVIESVPWSLGALLRGDPERWGPRFLAAFGEPAEAGSGGGAAFEQIKQGVFSIQFSVFSKNAPVALPGTEY